MTGNTHHIWGGAVSFGVLYALGALRMPPTLDVSMVPLVATILGSVALAGAPDVDLKLHLPHRTITHSLVWPLLILFFVPAPYGPALAAALASHIILDMLAGRVQALWPLPWWVGIQLVKTGGATETMFNVVAGGLLIWMVLR
jgi:membrane-bound metal-dependent hydrolase YbcI (DUF457 family)